ncbi:MAG: OmpH family outer membrane protein, partial [Burkholderiaceae bacterium]
MIQTLRQLLVASCVAASSLALPALAEDFRVGFVNTDRIFREANTAKAAQTKLEQEFSKREKDINDLANTLRTTTERFERDAPTLSESQRQTRQKQLI